MCTVYFDVDTQIDFVLPAGSLYVRGAECLLPVVARLHEFAASRGVLVFSTVSAHCENDAEFSDYPAHCVRGTAGQRKPDCTRLSSVATLPEGPAMPPGLGGVQQVLVEKSSVDCFTNRNLTRLLASLGVSHCVVYGVATEVAVRHAALGLLWLGYRVTLVADAIQGISQPIVRRTLADFLNQGGALLESTALMLSDQPPMYGTTVR